MPALFTLDSLSPDVLRCRTCGAFVANVADLHQADEPRDGMTARQALRCWPGAARDIATHDAACEWAMWEAEGLAVGG